MNKIKEFILKHFEVSLIILIFVGILAIAFLVHYKFSFLNFFFLPVILSAYFLGKRRAVLTAIFCILLMVLYLLFFKLLFGTGPGLSLDAAINLITWGGFLILTGAIIGNVSEQRESRIRNLRRSYIGSLEILLKYMEVADDLKPRSVRVAFLAGKMAEAAGLEKKRGRKQSNPLHCCMKRVTFSPAFRFLVRWSISWRLRRNHQKAIWTIENV